MSYFLGIDQGGTKTHAIVCDAAGHILGTGLCDGLATWVYSADTQEVYLRRVRQAADAACAMAGIALSDVTAVCGGMNGADWPCDYAALTEAVKRALHHTDVLIVNDCIGAMAGGTTASDCAIICAGTGMNIALKRADGKELIYGYYIPDALQGASGIGHQAFTKIMDAHVGVCGKTLLTELILHETGYASAEQLLMDVTLQKKSVAMKDLAPLLFTACALGDAEATSLVEAFCEKTAAFITAGARALGMHTRPFDLVYSGGMFKGHGALAIDIIHAHITRDGIPARKTSARYEPVCGTALLLLAKAHGGTIPSEVMATFDRDAVHHGLVRNLP